VEDYFQLKRTMHMNEMSGFLSGTKAVMTTRAHSKYLHRRLRFKSMSLSPHSHAALKPK